MFTPFLKTPAETMKAVSDYFSVFPKTEDEMKESLEKVKAVMQHEIKNTTSLWNTYQKAATGDATFKEITEANKKLQKLLVSARFGALMLVPGSFFALPALVKFAKEYDVNIIPESVQKEFAL